MILSVVWVNHDLKWLTKQTLPQHDDSSDLSSRQIGALLPPIEASSVFVGLSSGNDHLGNPSIYQRYQLQNDRAMVLGLSSGQAVIQASGEHMIGSFLAPRYVHQGIGCQKASAGGTDPLGH